MTTHRTRKIGLAFALGLPHVERLLPGFLDYARQQGGWLLTRMHEQLSPSLTQLQHWHGDGALVTIMSDRDCKIAQSLPFPVVNLMGQVGNNPIPTVTSDNVAIGRMAAEHLISKHFKQFSYYRGIRGGAYSEARQKGFIETVFRADANNRIIEQPTSLPPSADREPHSKSLSKWLKSLTPPVGIMASSDLNAWILAEACNQMGLRIPDDVAIIGVDNDPVACEFCHPMLSSIARNDYETGWQAAKLLDSLMSGGPVPEKQIVIPPERVVMRQSTDTMAIDDPVVAEAVRYIQDHLQERFGVERIIEHCGASRRQLEQHVHESLKVSPYTLICMMRVDRAKRLLVAPKKRTFSEIATTCGFSDLRHFRQTFKRQTGKTPAQFRKDETARETGKTRIGVRHIAH